MSAAQAGIYHPLGRSSVKGTWPRWTSSWIWVHSLLLWQRSQQDPGLNQQGHQQQRQRCHYPALLSTCQTIPGIVNSVFVPASQKNRWAAGEAPEKGHKDDPQRAQSLRKGLRELGLLSRRLTADLMEVMILVFNWWLQRRWRVSF